MTVYMLRSVAYGGEWYVGVTADLDKRLADHNAGKSPHTSKFRPWRVAVSLWFEDDAKAIAFEKYLKSGSGRAFAQRHFR